MALADRRRLRRKLGFWRLASLMLLLGGIGVAAWYFSDRSSFGMARAHIARIAVTGMILDDRELTKRIEDVANDPNAKALVISINSPGGSTYGGERLYQAIRHVAAKKPVVSDIRTLAASAGYMIAVAGDYLIAGETSITGSIGVIFQYPQTKPLLDKLGVSLEEIKSAPMKAEPSPFHSPPDEAKAMIKAMVDDSFDWFVSLVAERRQMPRETVLALADGRILTGRQALAVKLIDKVGTEEDLRSYLAGKGIDRDLPLIDHEPPAKTSLFGFGASGGWLLHLVGLSSVGDLVDGAMSAKDKLFLDGLVSVWQVDPEKT